MFILKKSKAKFLENLIKIITLISVIPIFLIIGYILYTGIPAISPVAATAAGYVPGELTYSVTGTTGTTFPKRLIFPDRTRRVNSNTPAEVAITVPVWWAQ